MTLRETIINPRQTIQDQFGGANAWTGAWFAPFEDDILLESVEVFIYKSPETTADLTLYVATTNADMSVINTPAVSKTLAASAISNGAFAISDGDWVVFPLDEPLLIPANTTFLTYWVALDATSTGYNLPLEGSDDDNGMYVNTVNGGTSWSKFPGFDFATRLSGEIIENNLKSVSFFSLLQ
jgi:hypothetical protein